jgi:transcriptional regulator with XRE-family HTH domain
MPRFRPDDLVKRRMWAALLRAAKRHHGQVADRGMVTQIARDAGVSKAAVSDWKNLGNYPEASTLSQLADLYRVSAEELSGYIEQTQAGLQFGPPEDLMQRSTDITEHVLSVLRPNSGLKEIMAVSRRASELVLKGLSDREVKGHLFEELTLGDGSQCEG